MSTYRRLTLRTDPAGAAPGTVLCGLAVACRVGGVLDREGSWWLTVGGDRFDTDREDGPGRVPGFSAPFGDDPPAAETQ